MNKGILIAFEGSDGAGKSTALRALAAHLEEEKIPFITTREPGGSPLAEKIRALLLDPENEIDGRTEALLYAASRRDHLKSTILPAMEQGKVVLTDRFLDSSLAYQGAGRELGEDVVEQLNDFGLEGFRPDAILFYDLDPQIGKARIEARGDMNRLDMESLAFFHRVCDGFAGLLRDHPDRYIVIDASQSMDDVAKDTIEKTDEILRQAGYGR